MFCVVPVLSRNQLEAIRLIGGSAEGCTSESGCLCGMEPVGAIQIVARLIGVMKRFQTKQAKQDFICSHIQRSFVGYSEKGYAKFNWSIGCAPHVLSNCCRWCFQHFYNIGNTQLTALCRLVKQNKDCMPSYSDFDAPYVYTATFKNELNAQAQRFGITLDHSQIAALQIPNTEKVCICVYV